MKRYSLTQIIAASIHRPPGFMEDVLSHGEVDGDSVTFTDEDHAKIMEKYRGDAGGCQGCGA